MSRSAPELPDRYNASTILDANLEAGRGAKLALIGAAGSVTYEELFELTCQAARSFRALGVRREERVLLVLDDSPEFVAAFWGAIRMGAVPVPVNPLLQHSEDYDHYLEDSLARLVLVDDLTADKVRAAAARAADPPHVLHRDPFRGADSSHLDPAPTRRDDMAFWLYSSGSTGKPKAVVHLQHDIAVTCQTYGEQVLGIRESDTTFSTTKLFHAYGLGNGLSFPQWVGATAVQLAGRPAPQAVLQVIAERRPTLFFSAPTLYNALLNHPQLAETDLSSLRHCVAAGESLPAEVWRRWKERTGLTILDGIGSTEMLHIYCSNRLDEVRAGSSGKAVPGYELRILDDSGRPVATGEAGDMYVRGDSALALYWAQHEKTKRSLQGEWFFSGDRYRQDADGFHWYEGRSDDMIKVSGLWVSPIEIEAVLIEHPTVAESAVVGFDEDGFTKIRAFVVVKDGIASPALAEDLREHCKSRLQRYQFPHQVVFVDDLPKTLTGKIQRYKLRQGSGLEERSPA